MTIYKDKGSVFMIKISPSILSSDFANLESELNTITDCGADWAHVDVMDGHFVPNITIGIPVVKSLKKVSNIPLDVHLMISDPLKYAPEFAKAGSDIITFHIESESDVAATIEAIKQCGAKVGISLKPATPADAIFPYLDSIDMALIMTVEPGFGGQSFMADMVPKVKAIADECRRRNINIDIQVDGGIDPKTVVSVAEAGANVFVAGSAVFKYDDYSVPISEIRAAAQKAYSK